MANYVLQIVVQGTDAASGPLQAAAGGVQEFAGAASGATGASEGFFSSIFKNAANIAALGGMLGGVASSIAGVASSLVSGNAQFEGYEARFASLMGSVDAAKAKIGELSQFASTTPFDLPGVVETSQKLQVFGGAALNTQENLTVVGNAAAASGQRIQDVGFWYARAYSSIQNGQPFGEAAQNLQQMGVMSGETAIKLTALQKSGADGTAVWQAFTQGLNAPTDAMQKMGQTWEGLSSTLADTWDGLVRTFSAPLFDALKPQMSNLINTLSSSGLQEAVGQLGEAFASVLGPAIDFVANDVIPAAVSAFEMIAPAVQSAVAVVSEIGAFFGELAGQAVAWGANIMDQFGAGIMASAQAVIDAVMSIGSIITEWLQPGSPPKITPNLDKWGTEAANVYMGGWGQADYSVFNSIGDGIKSALEGIAKASGDKNMNVAAMVLGDQANIAQAIDEVHTLGSVSEDTFNKIIAGAGPAGPQISGLVRSYLDLESATQNVARAQDELNNVTAEYSAKLDPLKGQLKDIQNQKQAIQDAQRLAKLQEEVANAGGDAAKKQLALLEIQEIQTRQQIRTTEADRDVAVGAAKAKLDAAKQQQAAAKSQVDTQKALLDSQNKTNALLAAQVKALGGAAGAHKAAAGAAAAHAKAQVDVHGPMAAVNTAMSQVGQTASAASADVNQMASGMRDFLAPAITFVSANMSGIMGALTGIGAALASVWAITVAGPAIWAALGTALSAVGTALAFILSPIGLLIVASAALGAAISTNFMGIGTLAQNLMGIFGQFGAVIAQAFAAFQSGGISAALATFAAGLSGVGASLLAWAGQLGGVLLSIGQLILTNVLTWGAAFVGWVAPYIPIVLAELGNLLVTIGGWIVTGASVLLGYVVAWGTAFVGWIAPYIPIVIAELSMMLTTIGGWVVTGASILLSYVASWGQAFIGWVAPMIPPALAELGTLLAAVGGWIVEQAPALVTQFLAWGQALLDWVAPYIPPALAALAELASSVLGWIGEQVGPLVDKFMEWASALIEWIGPAIPPAIAALGGLADSFFGWIGEQVGPLVDKFMEWAGALIEWIGPAIPPAIAALSGLADSFFGWIGEQVGPLVTKFAEWAGALVEWIVPATVQFLAAWPGMLDGFLTWIGNAVGPILAKLADWALAFIGWIAPMIPGFLLALAGIALALGTWIVETVAVIAAKIVVWGGAFLGWVATDVLPKLPGILGGILSAIGSFIGGAISWLANEAAKLGKGIIDGVVKGLGDIGKVVGDKIKAGLSGLVDTARKVLQVNSPSKVFASEVGSPIVEGIALGIQQNGSKATGAMLDLASKLIDVVDKGVGAFGKLAQLGTVPRGAVQNFADAIKMSLDVFSGVVMQWDKAAMSAASQFTKKAGDVVEMMSKGLDFLLKLDSMRAIPVSAIHNFASALQTVMNELIAISTRDMRINLMAAVEFAVSAGKILEAIGKGVDGLAKLGSFTAPAAGAFIAFRDAITQAVGYMLQVTSWFANYPVSSAVAFADSAGKIITMIGTGVESLKKLVDFAGPSVASFTAFRDAISNAVGYLIQVATWFANQPVGAAVAFATSAGQIVDVIGKAVDSFAKLADFVAPTETVMLGFAESVRTFVALMAGAASAIAATGLASAQTFADAASKVVAFIGAGVGGLGKLTGFVAPPEAAMAAFSESVRLFVAHMQIAASSFTSEALTAALNFADAASKAIGMIKTGVDALAKLADFQMLPDNVMTEFAEAIRQFVVQIEIAAASFSTDGLKAAQAFAESAGKTMMLIGTATAAFERLNTFTAVPQSAVLAFEDTLYRVMEELYQVTEGFTADMLKAAAAFAEGVQKPIALIGGAVDAFAKLQDFQAVPQTAILAFEDTLYRVIEELYQVTEGFTAEMLTAATSFAEGVQKPIGIIGAAVDAFNKLQNFSAVPQGAILAFEDTLYRVVEELYQVTEGFTTPMLDAANAFATAVAKPIGIIGTSVDAFNKLQGFSAVPQKAVLAFEDTLYRVVEELYQVTEGFSAEMLIAAQSFATNVSGMITFLGVAVEQFNKLQDFKAIPQSTVLAFEDTLYRVVEELYQVTEGFTAEMLIAAQNFAVGVTQTIGLIGSALQAFAKLADFKGSAGGVVSAMSAGIAAILRELQATTIPAVGDLGGAIIVAFGNGIASKVGQLDVLGNNMMIGLANGIISHTSYVVQAMVYAVQAAINAAQQTLGIASPSKVFKNKVGVQISAGMAEGVLAGAPQVQSAISGVSGMALGGASGGGGGGGGSISIVFQPGSIVQQPGEDMAAFADRVAARVVERSRGRR